MSCFNCASGSGYCCNNVRHSDFSVESLFVQVPGTGASPIFRYPSSSSVLFFGGWRKPAAVLQLSLNTGVWPKALMAHVKYDVSSNSYT